MYHRLGLLGGEKGSSGWSSVLHRLECHRPNVSLSTVHRPPSPIPHRLRSKAFTNVHHLPPPLLFFTTLVLLSLSPSSRLASIIHPQVIARRKRRLTNPARLPRRPLSLGWPNSTHLFLLPTYHFSFYLVLFATLFQDQSNTYGALGSSGSLTNRHSH